MGTIASVLQWTCTTCNVVNPTECLKCIKCGNIRRILSTTTKSSANHLFHHPHQLSGKSGLTSGSSDTNDPAAVGSVLATSYNGECFDEDSCYIRTAFNVANDIENQQHRQQIASSNTTLPGYVEISSCGNESRHVYKTLLRGCLRRPQRQHPNIPQVNCIICEDTRKYIKNSIELFHHFSNPNLNRRWICQVCELENNSVTWHCVTCDSVSYLAPIYKETLVYRKQQNQQQKHMQQRFPQKQTQANNQTSLLSTNAHKHQAPFEHDLSQKNERKGKEKLLRRTRSLSMDSGSSCRNLLTKSCHICFVNNCKNIFNLPESKECKHQILTITQTATTASTTDATNLRLPSITLQSGCGEVQDRPFNYDERNTRQGNLSTHNNQRPNKSFSNITGTYFGENGNIIIIKIY